MIERLLRGGGTRPQRGILRGYREVGEPAPNAGYWEAIERWGNPPPTRAYWEAIERWGNPPPTRDIEMLLRGYWAICNTIMMY